MNIDATQVGAAPHQQIPNLEVSLICVTTAGESTVAGYFRFRWRPEVGIRRGQATDGQGWPKYLSSDNDPLFQYHRLKANLRVLEIEEIKSIPQVPMSHPFVGRLIESVRRELLDHTLF